MEPPPPQQQGFDSLYYGLALSDCSEQRAEGAVEVGEELTQADGFVHGGVLAALAEALATRGTAAAVAPDGKIALALAIHTAVLQPVRAGTLSATAVRRHSGRTTWIWDVEITDGGGRRCAAARVTVAVRDR